MRSIKVVGFLIIGLILLTFPILSQERGMFAYEASGARAAGLGMSGIAMCDDAFASLINPSLLANQQKTSLFFSYNEVFNSKLKHNSLGVVSKAFNQPISIMFDCLSAEDVIYQEKKLQIGLARTKGSWSFGINTRIYNLNSVETANGFGADLGLLWKVRTNLTVGFLLKDLISEIKLSTGSKEYLHIQNEAGCSLDLPQFGTLFLQAGKGLKIGFEKWYNNNIALRGGLNDGNLSVGMSLIKNFMQVDYVYSTHLIGGTHQLSVSMNL